MEQHHISVMISEEEIEKRVCELAAQISSDFAGETVKPVSYTHLTLPTNSLV